MHSDQFKKLPLHQSILQALFDEGYQEPTPVQLAAIPEVLAGRDLLATAQTGTGKTAAFALPMLHLLHERPRQKHPRALILTPTRELALQINLSLRTYGRYLSLHTVVLLGGVSSVPQIKALKESPDILVATPGRLLDLINQGHVRLDHIEMLVLDEADRMLDMGFINDVRRIVSLLPRKRQTMLFGATIPPEIAELASCLLNDPSRVEIAPVGTVAENIEQKVLFVNHTDKRDLLNSILHDGSVRRALVFTRTKHRADRLTRQLLSQGIDAVAIHSNKSQGERQRALSAFDRGLIKVLVGTDIVARGIDVEGISHVINYEMPNDPESYVHRIGRTARAGAAGIALSFCDAEELSSLQGIEKLTKSAISTFVDHPFHSKTIMALRDRMAVPNIPVRFQTRRNNRQMDRPGRRAVR